MDPELEIEAAIRTRIGRDCVYVTSGRLGVYLSLVALLSPGDRVLMSPITDDVVLFTMLAARIRPVMAPVSPEDGNIDLQAIPSGTWESIDAVMTTNLYGLPDRLPELRRLCDRHGLLLLEDAAHAQCTDVAGRAIGSFGEISVFSLSKHAAGVGGVISFADTALRPELLRLRDALVARRPLRVRASDALKASLLPGLDRTGVGGPLRSARRLIIPPERREHRMPLRPEQLRSAVDGASGLDPFESWVRTDKFDYRLVQRRDLLAATAARVRSPARDRAARTEGVELLRELPGVAPPAAAGDPRALFRVPLLVENRDAAGATLEAAGHPFDYVYDVPLDDYAGPDFVDPSPSPEAARWWGRHVLPVDPLLARPALDALSGSLSPARPPRPRA